MNVPPIGAMLRRIRTAGPGSVQARFRDGVAWNMVALAAKQGSTFVVGIGTANLIGRELFGQYAILLSTVQSLAVVAGLAMGYTATKYVAELRATDPVRAGRVLALCAAVAGAAALLMAGGVAAAAPMLAERLLGSPDLTALLRVAALALAAVALSGFAAGALVGLEAYRSIGQSALAAGAVHLAAGLGLAWSHGLPGAIVGLCVANILHCILLLTAVLREARRQNIRMSFRSALLERPVLVRFAIPGALSGLITNPAFWLAQVVLAREENGFQQLALYAAAYSIMAIVLLVPNVANSVGMSLLNHALGGGRQQEYRRVFWGNLWLTFALVLAGAAVLGALGRPLLGLFGPEFTAGYTVLLILLLATLPEGMTIACNQVLQSHEKMWHAVLGINVPRDAVLVLLAWLLAPRYGAIGLALAYFAARTVALVIMLRLVTRIGVTIGQRHSMPAAVST